jgi:Flp pilus assembly protein TadG
MVSFRFSRSAFANEQGQAMLEAALTLPVLLLLLVGAAELGRVNYAAIELTNAAKAGAQYGAQSPEFQYDSTGITLAAQNEANDIYSINNGAFSVTSSVANICSSGSQIACSDSSTPSCTGGYCTCTTSTGVPICTGNNTVESLLTVNTSVTFNPLLFAPTFGSAHTFTLTGIAKQKVLIQ